LNIVRNKHVVKEFFTAINEKHFERINELLHEELNWWILGNTQVSGERDKRKVIIGIKYLHRYYNSFKFDLMDMTSEDDRVSITAMTTGTSRKGNSYNNNYHFLIFIKDGQIIKVREYFDTDYAIKMNDQ
jgi:ketosteroid isomerase-like protein